MRSRDLTTGSPWKAILLFSIPLMISATLQQLYNLADNFIAGHFISSLDSFNAVGIVYPITVVFLDIAVGVGVGCGVIAAKFFGGKDMASLKTTANVGLITTLVFGLASTAIGLGVIYPLLKAMISGSNGDGCFNEALKYMLIYIGGVIFLFLYNYSMYMFQAFGDSRTPLYFLIFSTLLNVGLDILFVMPIKLSSAGLALGTVISEAIAGVASVIFLYRCINKFDHCKAKKFSKPIFNSVMGIAIPSILQGCFISIGGVLITSILTGFGGNSVAGGYSASYKICYIVINIFTVLCNALSSYVSQNVGAQKFDRIMKGYVSTLIIAIIVCAVAMLGILPFRELWVRLFLTESSGGDVDAIVSSGMLFMLCVVPFFVFMVIKIPLDGILKGSTDMLGFTIGTSADLVARVVAAYLLGSIFGYEGVFFAWPIGWGLGTIISVIMFFSGRWKRKCHFPLKKKEEEKAA